MKILIRLPNWLGDVVMSAAFVSAVRQLYPDAVVDVIIKKELAGLASLIPGVSRVHSFSKHEFKGLPGAYRFGKSLRPLQYGLFFNLPSSLTSITMAFATGAKKRIGFGTEGGIFLLTRSCRRPKNVHRVKEYLSLLEQFTGKPITDSPVKLEAPFEGKDQSRVLINFNSEAISRRMPLNKGRELLNLISTTFTTSTFALIGGPKDNEYVQELLTGIQNTERIESYCGKTGLAELASLMADSAVLLTVDSGPAHLANSVGLPVVVLFGAGDEKNTAPYNPNNLTIIRAAQLSCEPCVRNTCKLYGIPKCMQLLDQTRIMNALSKYINHA